MQRYAEKPTKPQVNDRVLKSENGLQNLVEYYQDLFDTKENLDHYMPQRLPECQAKFCEIPAGEKSYPEMIIQSEQNEVTMNKRRHQRVEVQNLVANLSDGVECFSGTVSDICRLGMLLNDIPQRLKIQGKNLSIMVFSKGKNFNMQVELKWVGGNKSGKKMGVAILDPPLDWTLFALIREPKDEDIWAATSHLPGF